MTNRELTGLGDSVLFGFIKRLFRAELGAERRKHARAIERQSCEKPENSLGNAG